MTNRTKTTKLGAVAFGFLAGLNGSTALADIVHLDDTIIQFSLCVGNDCVNGESFGFDTLRLKENNVRMHFDDTSNSASFPQNDWRLIANDSGNGGANYLAIEDSTAGRQIFRVDAGAPANSLRVDSAGDVGIGVDNPVVDLHVKSGNSPTLRLEQDGSSGFTPQSFDVAANEANFFVRDVSNGSALPFKIIPGAATGGVVLSANDNVGIGLGSNNVAHSDLDVRSVAADTILTLSRSNAASTDNWQIKNKNSTGTLNIGPQNGNTPIKVSATANTNLLKVGLGGANLVEVEGDIEITGTITTGGSCSIGCDRVFDADYDLSSIEEHSAAMWSNGYLPNVGATAETGQYDLSNKVLRMLNELEHAHIYIAQMNEEFTAMREQVASLEAKLVSQN
jgi:hypothetical protein